MHRIARFRITDLPHIGGVLPVNGERIPVHHALVHDVKSQLVARIRPERALGDAELVAMDHLAVHDRLVFVVRDGKAHTVSRDVKIVLARVGHLQGLGMHVEIGSVGTLRSVEYQGLGPIVENHAVVMAIEENGSVADFEDMRKMVHEVVFAHGQVVVQVFPRKHVFGNTRGGKETFQRVTFHEKASWFVHQGIPLQLRRGTGIQRPVHQMTDLQFLSFGNRLLRSQQPGLLRLHGSADHQEDTRQKPTFQLFHIHCVFSRLKIPLPCSCNARKHSPATRTRHRSSRPIQECCSRGNSGTCVPPAPCSLDDR